MNVKRNDYQNSFLQFIADMQETRVDIMEMIDGYSSFTSDKMDIINTKTGKRLKTDPFIELHDDVCDYIKYE